MAQDDDGQKRRDGGGGAVFLILVVLAAMAFVGDSDNPLDRMADIVMIVAWIMAIGLLIFVIFFFLAYCMQTAMSDLYESFMDDLENSPLKAKIEHYKSFLDEKVFGRSQTVKAKPKRTAQDHNESAPPKKKSFTEKLIAKPKPRKPKTKKDMEEELQRQLEEDVLAMMDEENKKKR